jgi:hypothetical protein
MRRDNPRSTRDEQDDLFGQASPVEMPHEPGPSERTEVVFVQGDLPDLRTLLQGMAPGLEVHVIDPAGDGLQQVADVLAGRSGIDAVHLMTHGRSGAVALGRQWLDNDTVTDRAHTLAVLGRALAPGADLLLYGCHVGAGPQGADFLGRLGRATGADVAASDDATGSAAFGGDWVLEVQQGHVDAAAPLVARASAAYAGLLAVSDENFDSAGLLYQSSVTSLDVGTWTFTSSGASDLATPAPSDQNFNLNLDGGAGDRNFVWNLGGNNVFNFSLKSTDGTDFDLQSFMLGSAAGSTSVTVSGWRDGAQAVSGETVDLTASDSAGNITYAFSATTAGGSYGQLTFGAAFNNVDEIRLAFSSAVTAEIDDIDISPAAVPAAITSATYNANTGIMTVLGSGMSAGDTIDTSKLTVTGRNGATYTLTSNSVSASSATVFSVVLSPTDMLAVNGLWNLDGTASVDGTSFNLSAASGWNATTSAPADTSNGVTVSSVASPAITSATYNVSTNVLTVSGSRMVGLVGSSNDITVGALTLTGEGGATYTLTSSNVDLTSAGSFSVTLNATDAAAVEMLFNRNGTSSTDVTTYRLSSGDDWNSDINDTDTSDINNTVTVSNVPVPAITSATYNASTGVLTVTGTGFTTRTGAGNDIDVSRLTLTGEGGATHTLTTGNVDITSGTSFTVTLNGTDRAAVDLFMNRSGTSSTGGTTYNLAAAEDWARGADMAVAVADTVGNGVTATVPTPAITSATYDASTGTLVVTGTGFVSLAGAANDIDVTKLAISGDSSAYTLTSSSVDVTGTTSFSVTLNATDVNALTTRLNQNGTSSAGATTYNLAAAEDWAAGAAAAVVVADLTGNGITVSNFITRPTVVVTVSDTALRVGETSLVTFTFSEAVTGFDASDVSVENGTIGSVSSSDGGTTWTTTLSPTSGVTDGSNLVSVAMAGVTSLNTAAAGDGTTSSNNYAIDTQRPTATITLADSALKIGDTSLVTVTFSEAVSGLAADDVTAANGTLIGLSSGDGGVNWTGTFTPTANVTDGTNLISLDTSGVLDAAGNTGTGVTDSANFTIDTARPTVTITVADSALIAGETSTVTFSFSEAVTGFTSGDLIVDNGALSAPGSGDGGITWTAVLTPGNGVSSATNRISLDLTGVLDAAGNSGSSSADSNNYSIDTVRPTATIGLSDTALAAGETATVTITFSEAVSGFTNADLTVANGNLGSVGSSDGGITWTAILVTLDNTGVTDASGNTGAGSTDSGNYAIDTARPTATLVVADSALALGETSLVTIQFSEAVSGFTNADLTVANGTLGTVGSSDGGMTWTATFTPGASVSDPSNVITLANTGVVDAAGNAGSGSTDSNNYAVDTLRPAASVTLSDSALVAGETALVTVTFSEAVTGFTLADLTVPNGSLGALSSSDGGITWSATYTPDDGVLDATNLITLDNSGVTDLAGNAGSGSTASANFTIDTADNAAPALASAVADGSSLVLTYTDANPLNAANVASTSAFSVTSGGADTLVTAVAVDGAARTVTLTLDTAVLQGEAVTVRYTDPTAGNDGNATQDLAGNDAVSFGPQPASNMTGPDLTAPTATLSVDDTDLRAGETATVTLRFSEPVADLGPEDLSAGSGSLVGLKQVDARTWTAVLLPTANTNAASNVVRLDGAGVHDRSGNAGVGTTSSNPYAVRSLDPEASITLGDSMLAAGESTTVTVRFSQAVTGLDIGDFTVQGGSLGTPGSSDGGLTWTAVFTPAAGYSSLSNVILLDHGGVRNAQGQAGAGSTSSANYIVDTQVPTLAIESDSSVLRPGESATLTFTFSEVPSGFEWDDVSVRGGTLSALAPTSDPRVYTAGFVPASADNALVVAGGSYRDLAGNAGPGASFAGIVLDGKAPQFDPQGSSPADDAAGVAVGSTLVLHFDEPLSASQSQLATVSLRQLSNGAVVPATMAINASGQLVIDPATDLAFDTGYAVSWEAGSLKDSVGNAVAALPAGQGYDFRTSPSPTGGPGTQDGVPVSTVTTPHPDGSSTETVSTPPVPATRSDDPTTPNPGLADVVVGRGEAGGPRVTVGRPAGVGVRSEFTTGATLSLREQLVHAALARESDPSAQSALVGGIDDYVPSVGDPSQVVVRTLSFQAGAGVGNGPVVVNGALGTGEDSVDHPQRQEALVIDVSQLPAGTVLQLDHVEFAIIIGASRAVGGGGANIVFGDGSSQFIVLGAGDDQLHGGDGDDTIGSKAGNDRLYGDAGHDHLVGGSGNDTLEGGAGHDVLQGGASDAGTWTFQLDAQGRVLSRFASADADLGAPASASHVGPWTAPGLPQDSDDRLAYSYQSADRLTDVAMLYRAATGQLPTLNELNAYSTSGSSSHQLAQAAHDHYVARHVLPQAIDLQVKALVETVWGAGTASDAIVALGVDHLRQGGLWADALLYLARDARSTQRSTDSQGHLNLTQPLQTSELGWVADAGSDVLHGGEGNDRLVGGPGSDWLDGGAGTDTAVFTGSVHDYHFHKVTVNGAARLAVQGAHGGDIDTLTSIERWEIGSRTYSVTIDLAALPDNVDLPLTDLLVELVGQAALPAALEIVGG